MSPELFLQVNGETNEIMTRPMKGTRPEQCTPEELLHSEKDAAELHMIVDLMRHDFSKGCTSGSVTVKELFKITTYSTIYHMSSCIQGQ